MKLSKLLLILLLIPTGQTWAQAKRRLIFNSNSPNSSNTQLIINGSEDNCPVVVLNTAKVRLFSSKVLLTTKPVNVSMIDRFIQHDQENTYYYSEEDRDKSEIDISKNGAKYIFNKKYLEPGRYIYVVSPDGKFYAKYAGCEKYIYANSNKYIHHSSFLRSGKVIAAGEFCYQRGRADEPINRELQNPFYENSIPGHIRAINSSSGHYQPDSRISNNYFQKILKVKGHPSILEENIWGKDSFVFNCCPIWDN